MEKIIVLAIVVAFIIWRFKPVKGIRTISTTELKEIVNDKDKIFIDVRTKGEYRAGHIRSFKNMPLGSDFSTLPKDKEIVVICQSGIRSMQACKQLKKLGFEKVTNVHGGMNAY